MKFVKQVDLEQFVAKETLKIIDSHSRKDDQNNNYNKRKRSLNNKKRRTNRKSK